MNDIEFSAKVLKIGTDASGKFIILDHTEFYPDGKGGQLGDKGLIGNSHVIKVLESTDNIIFHYVDQYPDSDTVECKIDRARRKDISIQHTAQHILSGAFSKLFNIETIGFHMGEDYTTIDLNIDKVYEDLIFKAEDLANEIVLENRAVKNYFVPESDLQNLNLRKKEDLKGNIRIVEVEGFDLSMCGGTHVNSTGEIGLIKIIKQEKVKKINTRLFFVAGLRALRDYREKVQIISNISQFLTTGEEEIFLKVQNLLDENKALLKENKIQKEMLFEHVAKNLLDNAEKIGELQFVFKALENYTRDDISLLGKIVSSSEKVITFLLGKEDHFFGVLVSNTGVTLNFEDIKKEFNNFLLRSWGNKNFMFFEFNNNVKIDDIKTSIQLQLRRAL
jgi:alanyl-tRNA synthetase